MERIQGLKEYVQTEHYLEGIGIGKEEQKEIQITYQPLAQGEYNINYWFVHPLTGKKLVLRVNTGSQMHLENQIEYEYHALELLADSGRTPVPVFVDGSKKELPYGVMVMEFLEGSALDYRKNLMEAAECLADIHSVPVKETDGLISPSNPLQAILDECNQMVQTYYESDLGEEKKKVQTENQERIKTPFSEMVRKFKKQKNAVVALCFIIFLIFLAFFGSKIVPYGINEYDYNAILQGPSMKHLFGTDEFGRDLFSRIICGTRISLAVGFGAVTVGAVCGTILGLLAGYYGGWIDSIIMRICDVLFAFPGLILAIAIVAILGSGMTNVVIAVAVFSTPTFARLVRSKTLTLKNSVFVLAARNIGVSDARILFHHILPGAIPDIIVQYSMSFGSSILTASSLSFLGMGAQPPTPEWGLLLSNGRNYMASAMYVTIFPGLAIFLTVLSFNLLGDGLRDALDPKLSD